MKIDASIVCFVLVVLCAVPVIILRTKTYEIGYELGQLKEQERKLRQKYNILQSNLAEKQRAIREKYLNAKINGPITGLHLPGPGNVMRAQEATR